jgi:hypothetical protein
MMQRANAYEICPSHPISSFKLGRFAADPGVAFRSYWGIAMNKGAISPKTQINQNR